MRTQNAWRLNRGFTLSELLITIGILALLALLALPTMGQLRQRSLDARCASNLRSTGMGLIQYLADHNGEFLPTKYWYSRLSTSASPGIRDYLGSTSTAKSTSAEYHYDSVLTCPVLKKNAPQKFPSMLNRCYSMNPFLIAKEISKADDPLAGDNPGSPIRMVNVPEVSKMWTFTDGSGDLKDTGEFGTVCSVSLVTANSISYPHQKKQNLVFLDGHIESLTKEEMLARTPSRLFWGDLRINP